MNKLVSSTSGIISAESLEGEIIKINQENDQFNREDSMPSSYEIFGRLTSIFTLFILFLPSICLSWTANYQWPNKEITIDISGANGTIAGESYKTLAITSMNNWLAYCIPGADFAFYNTDPLSDCSFNVKDSRNCTGWANLGTCSGTFTVGQTMMWLSGDNLTETDVALNSECNNNGYWTSTRAIAVLSHEYGHAVGLGHSSDASALMYPYLNDSIWFPQADDCAGFYHIYGFKPTVPSDFDRDGDPDILWQHQGSGEVVLWYMNGASPVSSQYIATVADTNWRIVGVSDFNQDGNVDILWHNQTSGALAVWFMSGTTVTGGAYIGSVGAPWEVVGVADMDGNGSKDILWHNQTSGSLVVWFMSGTTVTGGAYIGSVGAPWEVAGVADFDGNGSPDILWHDQTSGAFVAWLMDGTTVSGSDFISWVLPPWKVVAP
jgi:hypothetical protein